MRSADPPPGEFRLVLNGMNGQVMPIKSGYHGDVHDFTVLRDCHNDVKKILKENDEKQQEREVSWVVYYGSIMFARSSTLFRAVIPFKQINYSPIASWISIEWLPLTASCAKIFMAA